MYIKKQEVCSACPCFNLMDGCCNLTDSINEKPCDTTLPDCPLPLSTLPESHGDLGKLNMIKLDLKKQLNDGSMFYRFTMMDGRVIIWFTLHENKYIYSIGIKTDNLFSVNKTHLFADTDNNEPYYFKEVLIESYSLNYSIEKTKQCIKELELACTLAQEIENFFKNIFLQEYVD